MRVQLYLSMGLLIAHLAFLNLETLSINQNGNADEIVKIEMNLSAMGVESDDFPSISVFIDFTLDSSICIKTFFNPIYNDTTYSFTKREMKTIQRFLKISDLEKLKSEYAVLTTDQPRSLTKVYTKKRVFIIDDYGMEGEYPLQKLYKIAYGF